MYLWCRVVVGGEGGWVRAVRGRAIQRRSRAAAAPAPMSTPNNNTPSAKLQQTFPTNVSQAKRVGGAKIHPWGRGQRRSRCGSRLGRDERRRVRQHYPLALLAVFILLILLFSLQATTAVSIRTRKQARIFAKKREDRRYIRAVGAALIRVGTLRGLGSIGSIGRLGRRIGGGVRPVRTLRWLAVLAFGLNRPRGKCKAESASSQQKTTIERVALDEV